MEKKLLRTKVKILLLFFSMCWPVIILSNAVALTSEKQAQTAAENFLAHIQSPQTIVSIQSLQKNRLDTAGPDIISGWVAALSNGGYILISPSQTSFPIKAYSLKNDFQSLPENYRKFIETELELYARLETADKSNAGRTIRQVSEKRRQTEAAWSFLLNPDASGRTAKDYTQGSCLVKTTWNQRYPYNKFLPEIESQSTLTGCVNVALAQVMKFHQAPDFGRGSTSYSWEGQRLKTILVHPYYWENMLDAPGMAAEAHLQDEIAILIRDLSIVNQTSFGLTESSAYLHQEDFIRFFGYSDSISSMENDDYDAFFSTLKAQIDLEQPVLLSLPGHMVVVDGYKTDVTGKKFHLNMGWGGLDDNYYYLDEPVQTSSFIFQPDLEMVYNIKPCSGPDCIYPDPPSSDLPLEFITNFENIIIQEGETSPHKINGIRLRFKPIRLRKSTTGAVVGYVARI